MFDYRFSNWIDLPLAAAILVFVVAYFNAWARSSTVETELNLIERLPKALVKVVALILTITFCFWLLNLSLWIFVVSLLILGLVIAFFSEYSNESDGVFLLLALFVMREWSFGFPTMVLHPRKAPAQADEIPEHWIGATAVTLGPLRPYGQARLNDQVIEVVAFDGLMIDSEAQVIVVGMRNGVATVQLA